MGAKMLNVDIVTEFLLNQLSSDLQMIYTSLIPLSPTPLTYETWFSKGQLTFSEKCMLTYYFSFSSVFLNLSFT